VQQSTGEKVPAALQECFEETTRLTDDFCRKYLNEEYAEICRKITAALCRKRVCPLTEGKALTWAAGVVYSAGWVNFLNDKTQTPYMTTKEMAEKFGVGQSTISAKHAVIRDGLELIPMHPDYSLASRLADNPLVWMIEVNGFLMDARYAPREIQEEAYRRGLIPYLPVAQEKPNFEPAAPTKTLKFPDRRKNPVESGKNRPAGNDGPSLFDENDG